MNFHFSRGTCFIFFRAKGSKLRQAMVMRTLPSSSEENTARPFLIKIKEVPQMSERNNRINQAKAWSETRLEEDVVLMTILVYVLDKNDFRNIRRVS